MADVDIRRILDKFSFPIYTADERTLAKLWAVFYTKPDFAKETLISLDVRRMQKELVDAEIEKAEEIIKNAIIESLDDSCDIRHLIDMGNILYSPFDSKSIKKNEKISFVLGKIIEKIKLIIEESFSIEYLDDQISAIPSINWVDISGTQEIRRLILYQIGTVVEHISSFTEVMELCKSLQDISTDTLNILERRTGKLIDGVEKRAQLHVIVAISKDLQSWFKDTSLEEYIKELIARMDNYLDLVQEHGYLPSGEWRDRVEGRLAELNRQDLSSLQTEALVYRLSITPLGCEARDILEGEMTRRGIVKTDNMVYIEYLGWNHPVFIK